MSKSLKIELDVFMYESIDELKSSKAIDDLVDKVNVILKTKEKKANRNIVFKACKNAVSLLSSKKKEISPNVLTVYVPLNALESLLDTVVPNVSSDEDLSESDVTVYDIQTDSDSQPSSSSSPPSTPSSSSSSSSIFLVLLVLSLFQCAMKH